MKLGYYIGVGGVVTFKNGKKLKKCRGSNTTDIDCTGNGLPVPGTGAEPRQAK